MIEFSLPTGVTGKLVCKHYQCDLTMKGCQILSHLYHYVVHCDQLLDRSLDTKVDENSGDFQTA